MVTSQDIFEFDQVDIFQSISLPETTHFVLLYQVLMV